MTNAERFKQLFGLYATELWSKSEKDFLTWLNMEYVPDTNAVDTISRQAAIDAVIKRDANCGIDSAEVLKSLPSVQPRKGKWIKDVERFGDNAYHCSQCGAVLEKDNLEWRNNYYCYHCGACMKGN